MASNGEQKKRKRPRRESSTESPSPSPRGKKGRTPAASRYCSFPECGGGPYTSKYNRERHELTHRKSGPGWACPLCPITFKVGREEDLLDHLQRVHGGHEWVSNPTLVPAPYEVTYANRTEQKGNDSRSDTPWSTPGITISADTPEQQLDEVAAAANVLMGIDPEGTAKTTTREGTPKRSRVRGVDLVNAEGVPPIQAEPASKAGGAAPVLDPRAPEPIVLSISAEEVAKYKLWRDLDLSPATLGARVLGQITPVGEGSEGIATVNQNTNETTPEATPVKAEVHRTQQGVVQLPQHISRAQTHRPRFRTVQLSPSPERGAEIVAADLEPGPPEGDTRNVVLTTEGTDDPGRVSDDPQEGIEGTGEGVDEPRQGGDNPETVLEETEVTSTAGDASATQDFGGGGGDAPRRKAGIIRAGVLKKLLTTWDGESDLLFTAEEGFNLDDSLLGELANRPTFFFNIGLDGSTYFLKPSKGCTTPVMATETLRENPFTPGGDMDQRTGFSREFKESDTTDWEGETLQERRDRAPKGREGRRRSPKATPGKPGQQEASPVPPPTKTIPRRETGAEAEKREEGGRKRPQRETPSLSGSSSGEESEGEVETALPCWKTEKGAKKDRMERWASCVIPPEARYLGSGDWKVVGGKSTVEVDKKNWRKIDLIERNLTRFVLRREAAERRRKEEQQKPRPASDPSQGRKSPSPGPSKDQVSMNPSTTGSCTGIPTKVYLARRTVGAPEVAAPERKCSGGGIKGDQPERCGGCRRRLRSSIPPWETPSIHYLRASPVVKVKEGRCEGCEQRVKRRLLPFIDWER